MAARRYLVSGGAGFIGSNLVRALLERGDEVRVLDNFSTGNRANLEGLDVEIVEGELRSYERVHNAVRGTEVVYHLSSFTHRHRLVVKVILPRWKDNKSGELPEVASVTELWDTADWHEREVFDLSGINFIGHPDLRHRRFCPEPVCSPGGAEYAPLRTIYFGGEPIDVGIGPGVCGGGSRLFHRIPTVVALILRTRPGTIEV